MDETFRILKESKPVIEPEHGDHSNPPDFSSWIGPAVGPRGHLPDFEDLPSPCPMGEVFYKRVKGWFQHVQWPPDTTWSPNQRGMSLLELYVDFMSFTNTEAPYNFGPKCVGNSRKSAQYVLLDEQPIYRGDGVPLATMIQTWQRFWKWVRHLDISVPRLDVDDKQSMAYVGYSLRAPFISSRARPACGDKSLITLWKYFHQPQGRRRCLAAPLIL